jgi:hypothetical protein
MTFHAEVLDGRIVTSVVAEQPRIKSPAPTKRGDDDEHEENEHEENDVEEEGEDDDD